MILVINTVKKNQPAFLAGESPEGFFFSRRNISGSEKFLIALKDFLARRNLTLVKFQGVAAVSGPGDSFSSLRVGAAVANALGYSLKIPVAEISIKEFQTPAELIVLALQRLKPAKVPPNQIILPKYC